MNYQDRLTKICEFLLPFRRIWENEVMLQYPSPLADYPKAWIEELSSVTKKEDVIELEKKEVTGLLKNPELLDFYQTINALTDLESAPLYPSLPEDKWTFLHMIPKKQHEIRRLAPLVHSIYRGRSCSQVVDIGGGVGHLAQVLSNHYGLRVTSLDMNEEFQDNGRSKNAKNAKDPNNKVNYVNVRVHPDELKFMEVLDPESVTIGLHTCGPLANDQIVASAKKGIRAIVNLGCCYNKLGDGLNQNLSAFAKTLPHPIVMNLFTLTLASRAHRKMDERDYDFKLKVKLYRYTMHFLLHDEYGMKRALNFGNSPRKLYDERFSAYALEHFQRLGIAPKHTPQELDDFYLDPARQDLIWKMQAAQLIRNALGRVLEVYLLLDRAIYLEEQGYEVKLWQVFDETVSPRNLGLVATKS